MRLVRISAIVAVLLAVGVAPLGASAATPKWRVQKAKVPKTATDTYMNAVSCPSAIACTAVGTYSVNFASGGAVAERWDGAGWKIQKPPSKVTNLSGISCPTVSECVAVGSSYDSSTFTSTAAAIGWSGTKWVVQRLRVPKGSTSSALSGVSCTSATACIAVGYTNGSTSTPLALSWNGAKWAVLKPKAPSGSPSTLFNAVSCTSATSCIAVGQTFLPNGIDAQSLAEVWNGSAWTIQTVPSPAGSTSPGLFGVSCPAATACTAVGYYHQGTSSGALATLAEAWNGSSWSIQTTPAVASTLSAVSCPSTTSCTAVGFAVGAAVPTAASWDGATWSPETVATPVGTTNPSLYAVSCSATSLCTAVGSVNLSSGNLSSLIERHS